MTHWEQIASWLLFQSEVSEFALGVPEGGDGIWLVEDILELCPLHLIDTLQSQGVKRDVTAI